MPFLIVLHQLALKRPDVHDPQCIAFAATTRFRDVKPYSSLSRSSLSSRGLQLLLPRSCGSCLCSRRDSQVCPSCLSPHSQFCLHNLLAQPFFFCDHLFQMFRQVELLLRNITLAAPTNIAAAQCPLLVLKPRGSLAATFFLLELGVIGDFTSLSFWINV